MRTWLDQAACRGLNPDLWFPARETPQDYAPAKRVCAACPVRVECLEYALSVPMLLREGIFGGLSPKERQREARRRRAGRR